jgi:hypothetical protein
MDNAAIPRLPPNVKNLEGLKVGRLTVVRFVELRKPRGAFWLVKCACGTEKILQGSAIGKPALSCGCLQKEATSGPKLERRKHGKSKTKLAQAYRNMLERCLNPKCPAYRNYGGRGITICDEWLTSNVSFFKWAFDNGYSEELELDRADNEKGYTPENCRFVPILVNANNRRDNVKLVYAGEEKSVADWARVTGLPYSTLTQRIRVLKWPVEKAIETPRHGSRAGNQSKSS